MSTESFPLQLYLRETIEHGPLLGQHCYKFAITKADKGMYCKANTVCGLLMLLVLTIPAP